MFGFIQKTRNYFAKLPDKKRYIEFVTALLSIPVLVTVIYLNYANIRNQDNDKDNTGTQKPVVITVIQDKNRNNEVNPTPTQSQECIPDLGEIKIDKPKENETTSANPLTIDIKLIDDGKKHCSIVWSYRINSGDWSDFTDKDISIFNMESGEKTLEIQIKSIVSQEEETITRKFTYRNLQEVPTQPPTNTLTPTPSLPPTLAVTVTSTP